MAGLNNNLGMVAADMGEIEQALSLFKQAYAAMYAQNQLKNVNIAFSMTNIGRMYLELDENKKAQDWISRALDLRLEKLGEGNSYYVETLSAFTEIQIAQGNLDGAKESLQHAVKIRTKKFPANDWRTAESQALLALIEKGDNKDTKAHIVFNCNLDIVRQKLGKQHYRVNRLLEKQKSFKIQEFFNQHQCAEIN